VVVTPELELIAGARRIAALRQLGLTEVVVHVVSGLDEASRALEAQRDENNCRQPLRPSEAVKLAEALEKLEKARARQSQAQAGPSQGRGKKASGFGKLPEPDKGETRQKLAKAVGMKETNLRKARVVVNRANEDPKQYESVLEEMDRTGNIDRAYQAVIQDQPSPKASSLDAPEAEKTSASPNPARDIVEALWREHGESVCAEVHRLLGERLKKGRDAQKRRNDQSDPQTN
jgi:ParB family chromosome partitioning protein